MEWPFEDLVAEQLSYSTCQGWSEVLPHVVFALSQHPGSGAFSPAAQIHGSRNQGVQKGVAPLSPPSDPRQIFASFFLNFMSRGLTSRGRNGSTRRHNNDPTEVEVKTATRSLWAPGASGSIGKEGSHGAGVTEPDFRVKSDYYFPTEEGEGMSETWEIL